MDDTRPRHRKSERVPCDFHMKTSPVPVFYVKHLFADGFAPLFCIVIKEKYRNDVGLLQHEITHIEQQTRDGKLRWVWRYITSKVWRLAYEVEAYKVSIAHGMSIEKAAMYLARDYRLGITEAEAKVLLTN